MKKILYLIFGLNIVSCNHLPQNNDLKGLNLSSDVKQMRTTAYIAVEKFGELGKSRITERRENSLIIFDEKGKRTETNIYQSSGNLLRRFTYQYDDKDNRSEVLGYKSDGNLFIKHTYKYDERGNRLEINDYSTQGNLIAKTVCKYDKENNRTEELRYKQNGSVEYKILYKYDEKGNVTEKSKYKFDGDLISRQTFAYDEKRNLIEEILYMSSERSETKTTYSYIFGKCGNWIQCIEYQNGNPVYIIDREYIYAQGVKENVDNLKLGDESKEKIIERAPFQQISSKYYEAKLTESLLAYVKRVLPKIEERRSYIMSYFDSTPSKRNDDIFDIYMSESVHLINNLNSFFTGQPDYYSSEKQINRYLNKQGLNLFFGDGDWIDFQENYFFKTFQKYLTDEYRSFLELYEIRRFIYQDASVTLDLKDFGDYIYKTEKFLTKYPNSICKKNLTPSWDLEVYLLGTMENQNHVNWDWETQQLTSQILAEFKRYSRKYPDSSVAKIIDFMLKNKGATKTQLMNIVSKEIKRWENEFDL